MRKHRTGLVTWVGGPNYGTVLQAFALKAVLESLGSEVTIIRKYDFVWGVKLSLNHVLAPLGINILKTRDADTIKMKRVRQLQAETFRYKRIVGSLGRRSAGSSFDAYVCGSDQMWNTWNCFDPFFFLDFVRKGRKIAYSVSMGTPEIRPECRDSVRSLVSSFDAVSLREESGAEAMRNLTGRQDIRMAVDPTLLLDRQVWEEFASGAEFSEPLPGEYILCYLLRKRDDYESIIDQVRQNTGVRQVLVVPSGENPDLYIRGARVVDEAGPREFVKLVSKASCVLTDSYHGTLFSVNMGRNVINLRRFEDADISSQNSRLYDLAAVLGLGDRFMDGMQWRTPVDYCKVTSRLESLRAESLAFLKKALG